MIRGQKKLRLFFPDSVLPLGRVCVHFHRFFFCINEGDRHEHFAGPATGLYPPLQVDYQPMLQVVGPASSPLVYRRRSTNFAMPRFEKQGDGGDDDDDAIERLARLRGPILKNARMGWPRADDDDDDDGGGDGDGGGAGAPQQQQQQQQPQAGAGAGAQLIADDHDDEENNDPLQQQGKRFKRAPADEEGEEGGAAAGGARPKIPPPAFRRLTKKSISMHIDFNPNPYYSKRRRGGAMLFDKLTGLEIIDMLDLMCRDWYKASGFLHLKRPSVTKQPLNVHTRHLAPAGEEPNNWGRVVVKLPPGLGLAMDRAMHFRALGFTGQRMTVTVPRLKKQAFFGDSLTGSMSVFVSSDIIKYTKTGKQLLAEAAAQQKKVATDASLYKVTPVILIRPERFSFVTTLDEMEMTYTNDWLYTSAMFDQLFRISSRSLGIKGTPYHQNPFVQFERRDDGGVIPRCLEPADEYCETRFTIRFGSPEYARQWGFRQTDLSFTSSGQQEDIVGFLNVDFSYSPAEEDLFSADKVLDYVVESPTLAHEMFGNIAHVDWRADKVWPEYIVNAKRSYAEGARLDDSGHGALDDVHANDALLQQKMDDELEYDPVEPEPRLDPIGEADDDDVAVDDDDDADADVNQGGGDDIYIDPVLLAPKIQPLPNPNIKPADTFTLAETRTQGRCKSADGDKLPNNFYLVSCQGLRRDYITDIGDVSLAAAFTKRGASMIETMSPGCIIVNQERVASLDFEIWSFTPRLFSLPENDALSDGFIRAAVSFEVVDSQSRY